MNMLVFGLLGLIACGDKEDNTEDTSNNGSNTDTADNPDVEEAVSYCEFLESEVVDPMGSNGEYSCPAISVLPSGLAIVMATEATEGKTWLGIWGNTRDFYDIADTGTPGNCDVTSELTTGSDGVAYMTGTFIDRNTDPISTHVVTDKFEEFRVYEGFYNDRHVQSLKRDAIGHMHALNWTSNGWINYRTDRTVISALSETERDSVGESTGEGRIAAELDGPDVHIAWVNKDGMLQASIRDGFEIWRHEDIPTPSTPKGQPKIALTSDSTRWVTWNAPIDGTSSEIYVANDASGSWESSIIDVTAADSEPRIKVDSAERPHVLWHHNIIEDGAITDTILRHAVLVDGVWSISDGPSSEGYIDFDWGDQEIPQILSNEPSADGKRILHSQVVCEF